jgi:cell division septum initiation protein DivIVA
MTQEQLLAENTALKQKVEELQLEIKQLKQDVKELTLSSDSKTYSSLYRD